MGGIQGLPGQPPESETTTITSGGVLVQQSLFKSYSKTIAAAGEQTLSIKQPFPCAFKGFILRQSVLDAGDKWHVDVLDLTTDAIRVALMHGYKCKAALDYYSFSLTHSEPLLRDSTGLVFDQIMFTVDSEGTTSKVFDVDIEYIVPDDFLLICDCEKDTFFPATSDEFGATRALGSALTSTIAEDTTNFLTGLTAISWTVTAGNQTNDNYNGIQPVKTNNFNIDPYTYLYVILRASDKTQAEFGVMLEDSAGNYNYYTFTITANNTFERKQITLASPTGNGGTAADLTKIDKVWIYFQSKAAAAESIIIIDHIWCE